MFLYQGSDAFLICANFKRARLVVAEVCGMSRSYRLIAKRLNLELLVLNKELKVIINDYRF